MCLIFIIIFICKINSAKLVSLVQLKHICILYLIFIIICVYNNCTNFSVRIYKWSEWRNTILRLKAIVQKWLNNRTVNNISSIKLYILNVIAKNKKKFYIFSENVQMLKYVSLVTLTLQNALVGLSMRYARTRPGDMFLSSTGKYWVHSSNNIIFKQEIEKK